MGSDEEDFVFFGTPIQREEEIGSRKKKAVAEASSQLRSLPHWKQEVTDEEGRRRFHGAFTGGFSAGYYNTVGSKEGWTPQTFTSSRKSRAEVKEQNILNFLDEDEKAELEGRSIGTSFQFDTFGFTATEFARKQAEKEQHQRPSAIPGPVPDEIVIPATESIGVKLLLKMGWRRGRSIKDSQTNTLYNARREARKAFLAFSSGDDKSQMEGENDTDEVPPAKEDVYLSPSTPDYVIEPKQDLYGLGFDPYKHAPEFREIKKARQSGSRQFSREKAVSNRHSLFGFKAGNVASGFGIGALEELGAEDEDVYASEYQFEENYVQEIDDSSRLITDGKEVLIGKEQGLLPRFRIAFNSDHLLERFDPPVIPAGFIPHHKFSGPLETDYNLAGTPPAIVPPPDDNNLKLLIDGVATLVARCGKVYEDLSKEKNKSNPMFSFLSGENGHHHQYYAMRLWEEQRKRLDHNTHLSDSKSSPIPEKMTAESRGKILGEKPLERSSKNSRSSLLPADVQLQYNLSDTFTKPASLNESREVIKPFKDDPAKQERFEQYLKEKYHGGLRSTGSGGASNMSEASRARERLDFEAAAESIEKGKTGEEVKHLSHDIASFAAMGGMQFTSGGVEKDEGTKAEDLTAKEIRPKREEYQWRPAPILCKRFDLVDPFMGKPPPPPRTRSKIDSLIFMKDSVQSKKVEEMETASMDQFRLSETDSQVINEEEVEVANIERPVDLYKAIFSDDSDDEGDTPNLSKVENQDKKAEVASTTLNRLIAGDFLQSLGKELGLEVPPDLPPMNKAQIAAHQKGVDHTKLSNADSSLVDDHPSSTLDVFNGSEENVLPEIKASVRPDKIEENELLHENRVGRGSKYMDKVTEKKLPQNDRKTDRNLSHSGNWSDSSSEEEKRRKHSSRRRHRSSDSESDSSSGSGDDNHFGSKKRKKGHSREKSSSRKHSKYSKNKRRDSSPRDRYGNRKHSTEHKQDRRK